MKDNRLFYKNLKKNDQGLIHLFDHEQDFIPVPDNWYVVMVDIENSTQAVQNGLHHEVNISATGSIVVVMNELKKMKQGLKIPYFFGGDGTTFIIPSIFHKRIIKLLDDYRIHIKKTTSLILKTGSIQVSDIYDTGKSLRIAKLKLTNRLTIPIVLGSGLKYAEKKIKESFVPSSDNMKKISTVNLKGMECRWEQIKPLKNEARVVCLILNCLKEEKQPQIYKQVFQQLDEIFGSYEDRKPISLPKLHLDISVEKIRKEMRIRVGKTDWLYLIKNFLVTFLGPYYFEFTREGKQYLEDVTKLSDTIMVDGTINTVFSGTKKEIELFVAFANNLEKEGIIKYGIHVTHASIMSCHVENRTKDHIHFVDGTEGGYTSAAIMLKEKMLSKIV